MSEKRKIMRSSIFLHLDGIALCPTFLCIYKKGVLNDFTDNKASLSKLVKKYKCNEGYLNIALRLLCCQGWLKQEIKEGEIYFTKNDHIDFDNIYNKYKIVEDIFSKKINYQSIYLDSNKISDSILFNTIKNYLNKIIIEDTLNINKHLEGVILAPILVYFSRNNFLSTDENFSLDFIKNNQWNKLIKDLFIKSKLIDSDTSKTEFGEFIFKRASSYGVTVSYLETFKKLDELIFGNGNVLWEKEEGTAEIHVDRKMNVWGSGGAHRLYFQKVDEIIIDLFNLPIEEQPKGFIDIGCGDGALIEHIFDLIYFKTKRGKQLKKYPLLIIGSDFNYKALEVTEERIKKADIWANTAFGDIGDPDNLAKRVKEKYNINLEDLLNVRSFLDHNRVYTEPLNKPIIPCNSSCAFSFRGKRIKNDVLMQNLYEHFNRWAPYLKKYGLLVVELHSISPEKTFMHLGKNSMTAYDATHGYSDQYIIEYEYFLKAAEKAGLLIEKKHENVFPNKITPIVSVNRLISR